MGSNLDIGFKPPSSWFMYICDGLNQGIFPSVANKIEVFCFFVFFLFLLFLLISTSLDILQQQNHQPTINLFIFWEKSIISLAPCFVLS